MQEKNGGSRPKESIMRRIMNQNGMNYIQMLLVLVFAGILGALVVPFLTSQEQEEIRHVYTFHWIGYKLIFETGERVMAS